MTTVQKKDESIFQSILSTIKFYHTLNLDEQNDRDNLIKHKETYPQLLDNFIYLVTTYNDNIDKIYDFAIQQNVPKCDVTCCSSAQRYHRNKRIDAMNIKEHNETRNELQFINIRDLLDQIHCYFMHQYDFGYRIHQSIKNTMKPKPSHIEETENDISCKDHEFKTTSAIISDKKHLLGPPQKKNN
eukprot:29166_1